MTKRPPPSSPATPSAGRYHYISWLVLGLGLMLAAVATLSIQSDVERSAEKDFHNHSNEVANLIARRLDDHARILLSGAALFGASDKVTREGWRIFNQYQKIDQLLPGIQGMGFAQLIPRAELARHVAQVRSEGFPDYQVKPAGERETYSSIIYLEPFTGRNLRAFGYDMFSEPVRHQAMQRACDTNSAALTGKVQLVQETDQDVQEGTLMYVPVYRPGQPTESIDQRRAALAGWVYSPYRMKDLIAGILGCRYHDPAPQPQLQVFDGSRVAPAALLYASPVTERASHWTRATLTRQIPVQFNGHCWTLCFIQPSLGIFTADYLQVWLTLGRGLLITLLLFALIRVLLNTRAAAQRMATALTAELQHSEDSLRRTTNRLSLAARAGGVGIWDYDVTNNQLVWDEQMFALYGITRDQFSGAYEAWQAGLHPDDRQRGDQAIQNALRGDQEFDIEFRALWSDGTIHDIRGIATVERNASGDPLRMIGTNWDITAHKRIENALQESEGNFRAFFESMTDMITVGTPEGRILFTNSAVTQMLGYSPDELQGMNLLNLHPASKRQEAAEIFAAMFRGERASCPLPLEGKTGALVPVETRVWFGQWNGEHCVFGISKNLTAEQEAHQRFERLFRRNPTLIALSSQPDRRFTDVNDAFLETLGYAREEILGKTATELNLFVDPTQYNAVASHLQTDGIAAGIELQVRRKDGGIIFGLFSGEIISSQGRDYVLSVMIDITQRKHAEWELTRLSGIQRELMNLASEFVNVPLERQDAAIDQSLATMGQLIHADRAYLFAYDFGAGIMCNTHEWCGPGISPEIANLKALPNDLLPDWVAAHRRGDLVHVPSVADLPADDSLREVLEPQGIRSLITLPLMQGDVCLGFVGFDAVTEPRIWQTEEISLLRVLAELYSHFDARRAEERQSRELQHQLIQARDAAQAAALAKSLFLGNMSHEIRTPLNAILGYAQIMGRECGSCSTGQRLSAITRGAEHLLALLTDLLELVRSDAHRIMLAPCTFDFYQALEDVRLVFVRHPQAKDLTLDLSHTDDMPRFIHADPVKIRQILVNLLGNAVKFTTCGGVRLAASVLADGAPGELRIAVEVEDSGCGIDQDELEHIFEIFEQAPHGRQSGQGTGLGLPLSRRYAQALGGDITVTSRLGEGSRFRFTFTARGSSDRMPEPSPRGSVLHLAADQPACRVLVVDDEPENRDMLADMLTAVGFPVETTASAALALERLRQAPTIDLVLMDKRLPEMDGYEAISRLRELPGGRELAVLVVTASGFADENQLAAAAGADGYVSKPVRRERLLAEISRVTDVTYAYEPAPAATLAPDPVLLDPAALACLSEKQFELLNQALFRGDIRMLHDLITEIAGTHGSLAAEMRLLVEAYDYERLHRMLDAAKGTHL
ncbi:MAG: CHASE domain-containing protein [Verrucomicrobiota bacterium]